MFKQGLRALASVLCTLVTVLNIAVVSAADPAAGSATASVNLALTTKMESDSREHAAAEQDKEDTQIEYLSIMRCRGDHARLMGEDGEGSWVALSELRVVRSAPADGAEATAGGSDAEQCQAQLNELKAESQASPEQMNLHPHGDMSGGHPSLLLSLGLIFVGMLLGLIIASLRGARL